MAKKLEKFVPKEALAESLRKYARQLAKEAETCDNGRRKTAQDKLTAVNTCIDILSCARTAVFDATAAEYWLH